MTPAARSQAAIEILDQVIAAARAGGAAADTVIARYFSTRRYAGSKDRRAVRELVYAAIRQAGDIPESGRSALIGLIEDDDALAATFDGSTHGPAKISSAERGAERGIAPAWLTERLAASEIDSDEAAALIERAAGLDDLPLFAAATEAEEEQCDAIRAEVEALDVDALTPRDALEVLYRLKGLAREA